MRSDEKTATGFRRVLPIFDWFPRYQRSWLRPDFLAGLTVTALLIPEGMAYAQLAGVPPQTAFYAAPAGLLLYAIFGTSRQLVVAVSSAIAVMSAATVAAIVPEGSSEFVVLTSALALLAGLLSIGAGMLRLGRVAQFFSESVMTGFIFGLALLTAVKQLPKIFGIEAGHGDFFERVWDLLIHLNETHWRTLLIGGTCFALMLLLEHFVKRLPAALIVLVYGVAISALFDLQSKGVDIVGEIASGLSAPKIPDIALSDLPLLLAGAAGLALVVFAEAIGPARVFSSKYHNRIDANQELIGLGAANVGAGLFQGFPIGSSLSKSAANDAAGAKTQVSALVAAGMTLLVALFFTPLFKNLPEATLGAIVIVAVSGMMNVREMHRLFRLRRVDFLLAAVALLAVLVFDVLTGLLIAVIVSLAALVWRSSQPKISVLGRKANTLQFADVDHDDNAEAIPGLLIVRPDVGIFFANATPLRDVILARVRESQAPVTAVLLNLQSTNDLDVPGADMIAELQEDLAREGVTLLLCHVHHGVRVLLDHHGTTAKIGEENIYPRTLGAMLGFLEGQGRGESREWAVVSTGLRRTHQAVEALSQHHDGLDKERLDRLAAGLAKLENDLFDGVQQHNNHNGGAGLK